MSDAFVCVLAGWRSSTHDRARYQDELSARVQWTLQDEYGAGSYPPVVSVNGSCGSAALHFDVDPEQTITLDADSTYDADSTLPGHESLELKWWQFKEPSPIMGGAVPPLKLTLSRNGTVLTMNMSTALAACAPPEAAQNVHLGIQTLCQEYHIILEVKGSGTPPTRRYRRTMLKVRCPLLAHAGGQ